MKHKKIILFALLTQLFCKAQTETQSYNSELFLNQATELTQASKYSEAIKFLDKIHPLDKKFAKAQHEKTLALFYDNKLEEALELSTKNYNDKLYENYPPLILIHGILLSDNKKYNEAIEVFNEAEIYFPISADLNFNKSIAYIRNNEKQKAVDLLKKNLEIDPSHTSSLFNLGYLALEDGQLVEGNLLLMTYLLFEPESTKSHQALLALNKDYSKTYDNKPVLKIREKNGDDFSLLEEVLRNKYPYNSNFKLVISIDDLAPRNMQAITEYFKDHEFEDGYFENKFGKLFQDIANNKNTEFYLYHALLSLREYSPKEFSKNDKKIKTFESDYLYPKLWYEMYNNAIIDGKKYKINIENDSKAFFEVKNDAIDKGEFFYTSVVGLPETKGYYEADFLSGTKITFQNNGKIDLEENFENGKKQGESKSYYSNSKLFFKSNFQEDKPNGNYTIYYPSEKISCIGIYNLGEFNGENLCYFSDGTTKIIANYIDGKYSGIYKTFNEVGELTTEGNYIENEPDGSIKNYFYKDKLKSEFIYKDKLPVSGINYFLNGNKEAEYSYENGKLKELKNYYIDGKISEIRSYNPKEELISIKYFDRDGKIYYEDIFSNGKAKQSIQYFTDGTNQKLKQTGHVKFDDLDGKTISEGEIKNGLLEGKWQYYYPNQVLRTVCYYKDGNEVGERRTYLSNGLLDYVATIENNELNGIYKDYVNTKLNFVAYYANNNLNGPLTNYYYDGKIKSESFYENGLQEGLKKYYTQSGELYQASNFISDMITDVTYYFDGKSTKVDYINKDGIVEVFSTPVTKRKIQIKNGEKNGIYEISNTKNEFISKENFVNNKLQGKATEYSQLGKISADLNYHVNALHGEQKYYDLNGKLEAIDHYDFGYQNKASKTYHPNGKEFIVSAYDGGYKNGIETIYNSNGNPVLILEYFNGDLMNYQTLNNNTFSEKIPFTNKTTKIKSTYANGKPAIEINYKDGVLNGEMLVFNEQNQKDYQKIHKNGKSDGDVISYLNGKKYLVKKYENGSLEGPKQYFNEQENVQYSIDYKNNEMHGYFKILDQNALKPIKRYDSDRLVEIL